MITIELISSITFLIGYEFDYCKKSNIQKRIIDFMLINMLA